MKTATFRMKNPPMILARLVRTFCLLPPAFLLAASALAAATPADPSATAAADQLFRTSGKSLEAQKAFEALAAADPKNLTAQLRLGALALRRDDPDAAITHLEQAIQLAPTHSEAHRILGDAYGRAAQKKGIFGGLGLGKKCLAAYEKSVALDPRNVDARASLFEFYRQAPGFAGGSEEKAAAQVAAIRPLDAWRGRVLAATLFVSKKQYDAALAEFDAQLAATPDDYGAHFQIGRLAATTGQFVARGLTSLRRCLELTPPAGSPGHAIVHWRLGNLHEKKNDKPAARAAYEKSLALDPTFTPAKESLAKLK